ncbi:A24 family peptidase [Castellaniella sp. GW247-6E4]|uniref:prepilin peptidase n=1 Tax=Castellaniella sp. GW247-6E4 TaxID=3140380 RepID=UPI003314D582
MGMWLPWHQAHWVGVAASLGLALLLGAGFLRIANRLAEALGAQAVLPATGPMRRRILAVWWPGALVLAAVCGWRFGATPAALAATVCVLTLWTLAWIDGRTGLLPDGLTLPLLWAGLLTNLDGAFAFLPDAVLGAAAGYLCLWVLYLVFLRVTGREGMGFGDFKLTAALGAWLGWQALPGVLLAASLGGLCFALWLRATGRAEAGRHLVFGPWLALAGGWALLFPSAVLF